MDVSNEVAYQAEICRALDQSGVGTPSGRQYRMFSSGYMYAIRSKVKEDYNDRDSDLYEKTLEREIERFKDGDVIISTQRRRSGIDKKMLSLGYLLGLKRLTVYDE